MYKKNTFYNFFLFVQITKNYYQKYKEKLREKAPEKYENLSEEEKTKDKERSEKDIRIFLRKKKEDLTHII